MTCVFFVFVFSHKSSNVQRFDEQMQRSLDVPTRDENQNEGVTINETYKMPVDDTAREEEILF